MRESELLDALGRGFVGAELESHVATCLPCSELQAVASALLDDRVKAIREAPVPTAAAMWWRMQMRRRQEVQAASRRSLLIGQAVTLAAAMAVMVALFGGTVAVELREVIASIRVSSPLLLALATWIIAAPIAGWVAIRGK
ncbi:MAG: hypothetical protein JJE51_12955 [Thermoanaerobaculia bacterium]|nr:hypothetical protein [Thermoanaerobaculia bacterium]